eukprot:jgi/Mesvir1/21287/Mv21680-RA.1
MALNPELLTPGGLPVPFEGEWFVLARDGIELYVDNLGGVISGGKWSARGTLYLSSIRMVFVADKPGPVMQAFDMPLSYTRGEQFNQPIFGCNNITCKVFSIAGGPPGSYDAVPHAVQLSFKEGGVGTFLPLFFNLLSWARGLAPIGSHVGGHGDGHQHQHHGGDHQHEGEGEGGPHSTIPSAPPAPVQEFVARAFIDPKDPTTVYVSQPFAAGQTTLRRRNLPSGPSDRS